MAFWLIQEGYDSLYQSLQCPYCTFVEPKEATHRFNDEEQFRVRTQRQLHSKPLR